MGLTNKRRVFIEEYLRCWNATEAARRAEYKHPRRQGARLLSFVDIQKEVERRIEEKAMGANEVLNRLAEQARGDIDECLTTDHGIVMVNWEKLEYYFIAIGQQKKAEECRDKIRSLRACE